MIYTVCFNKNQGFSRQITVTILLCHPNPNINNEKYAQAVKILFNCVYYMKMYVKTSVPQDQKLY